MMEGSNIAYTAVEAYSLDPSNSRIISGGNQGTEVISGNIRFLWSFNPETREGGFTGVSWFASKQNTPLYVAGMSEKQIEDGLIDGSRTNLNDVFDEWQTFINGNPTTDFVHGFIDILYANNASGCWSSVSQ